jgi:predicted DNA-binding ribbon-helix-helix protein
MPRLSRNSARKIESSADRAEAWLIAGNIRIHGRRTSVRLEPEMWSALHEIALLEDLTIHDVCGAVDDCRNDSESFSSALRVFLLQYYRGVAAGGRKQPAALKRPRDQSRRNGHDTG